MSDPQKEAKQSSAFWASVRTAVEQVMKRDTPKIERTGVFQGKPFRASIYHVNETVPVRIDLKEWRNNKEDKKND